MCVLWVCCGWHEWHGCYEGGSSKASVSGRWHGMSGGSGMGVMGWVGVTKGGSSKASVSG